jgi:hypothetical protein
MLSYQPEAIDLELAEVRIEFAAHLSSVWIGEPA